MSDNIAVPFQETYLAHQDGSHPGEHTKADTGRCQWYGDHAQDLGCQFE